MQYLFLDLETTGFSEPKIVSLAYNIRGESIVSHGFFKPEKEIEMSALMTHHITPKMLDKAPIFKDSADFVKIQELLHTHILVAHNASYDIGVLRNEGVEVKDFICTKNLAQKHIPLAPSHRLQYLRYYLDLDVEGTAHDALGDMLVMRELFEHINKITGNSLQ